jgi:phage antirepressor YoqD-like protein
MSQVIKTTKHNYNGFEIQFEEVNGHVMASATNMCHAFDKKPSNWLALDSTKRYLDALQAVSGNLALVETRNGGLYPGTWVNEKLIVKLAQWLDVDFEVWCDQKIADLLKNGTVTLKPKSRIELARENVALIEEIEAKDALLLEAKPKIEFFDQVADSKDAIEIGQAAKVLNMGIGRNTLFEILRDNTILMHNNAPYQKYLDRGWFRVVEQSYQKPDGTNCINIKTLVYQKGLQEIAKVIQNRRGVAVMDN